MTTEQIITLVISSVLGSNILLELVRWWLKNKDSASASRQQQSVAQMDDDAKMRKELWDEIEKLRTQIASQQASIQELTRLNGELTGKNIASEAKIESQVQRLTAVTLDRDMKDKRIGELETKVDELQRQIAPTRRKSLGGIA